MSDAESGDFDIPEPTSAKSGTIKSIGKETVHKICAGQVVLSLAVAVKELVENAIDAGATLVEVKLRDQGLDSIEVSDNGSGVEVHNLEGMTAKYHTSKIREFVDLQEVETFGFRGEALSSLCALADMTIQSRHKSTDVGIKVELDHDGKIMKRVPCARSVGTTVTLSNLFVTLPVRRRDFTRNVKKEFTKMCQILQAYALVSKGVRIICSNFSVKGAKTVIMQTHGSQDILANISSIFGSRQATDIVAIKSPFQQGQISEETLRAELQSDAGDATQINSDDVERLNAADFQLEGYISSCSHGAGRSSKDRQFFYVNSRPCDPKMISKVVNEAYHRYNMQQYPFIYLNVLTARSEVDVNLTPDKRQLLLNNEKILLLAIKKALLDTFGSIPSTFKIHNSSIVSMLEIKPKTEKITPETIENVATENELDEIPVSSSQRFKDVLTQWRHTGDTQGIAPHVPQKRKCTNELTARTLKLQKIQDFLTNEESSHCISYKSESESENDENEKKENSLLDLNTLKKDSDDYDAITVGNNDNTQESIVKQIVCKVLTPAKARILLTESKPKSQISYEKDDFLPMSQHSATTEDNDDSEPDAQLDCDSIFSSQNSNTKTIKLDDSAPEDESKYYTCSELNTSLTEIELSLKSEDSFHKDWLSKNNLERLRFKSKINPNQNQNAEAELQKEISKESFAHMEILGQFNLGFIIVKLDDDLFIVDQHATDEKYNFEMLQRTTVLQYQKLAVPQTLEMTAVNEMILLDHLELFEKNGFRFEINESAPTTKKIRLLGKPFSKNWEFGKDDIDELIFMLQDAPEGTICRPSRIRAMFASRACRKSVMIGTALNKATMKTLVTHMGEIEQPWNCPHGRPTMRHLINIAMLKDEDETNDPSEIHE